MEDSTKLIRLCAREHVAHLHAAGTGGRLRVLLRELHRERLVRFGRFLAYPHEEAHGAVEQQHRLGAERRVEWHAAAAALHAHTAHAMAERAHTPHEGALRARGNAPTGRLLYLECKRCLLLRSLLDELGGGLRHTRRRLLGGGIRLEARPLQRVPRRRVRVGPGCGGVPVGKRKGRRGEHVHAELPRFPGAEANLPNVVISGHQWSSVVIRCGGEPPKRLPEGSGLAPLGE